MITDIFYKGIFLSVIFNIVLLLMLFLWVNRGNEK